MSVHVRGTGIGFAFRDNMFFNAGFGFASQIPSVVEP